MLKFNHDSGRKSVVEKLKGAELSFGASKDADGSSGPVEITSKEADFPPVHQGLEVPTMATY